VGILGTSAGTEPGVDGYLRGQVFNREVPKKKKYLRIKIRAINRRPTLTIPNYDLEYVPAHVSDPLPASFAVFGLSGEQKPTRNDIIASLQLSVSSSSTTGAVYKSVSNYAQNNWGGDNNYGFDGQFNSIQNLFTPPSLTAIPGGASKIYYHQENFSWCRTIVIDLSKISKFSIIPFQDGILDSVNVLSGWTQLSFYNLGYVDQMYLDSVNSLAASYTMSITQSNSDKEETNFNLYDQGSPIGYYQLGNLCTYYSSYPKDKIALRYVSNGIAGQQFGQVAMYFEFPISIGVDCPIVLNWDGSQPSIDIGKPRIDARTNNGFIGAIQY
jgi:hypothetical protein